MSEEFFLEVLGDPSLDDDVVGVALESKSARAQYTKLDATYAYLVPIPRKVVSEQGLWEQMLAVDLGNLVSLRLYQTA